MNSRKVVRECQEKTNNKNRIKSIYLADRYIWHTNHVPDNDLLITSFFLSRELFISVNLVT